MPDNKCLTVQQGPGLTFVPVAAIAIMNDTFSDLDKIEDADCKADIENDTIRVFIVDFSF